MDSKIIRTVQGDPADPKSTRYLSDVTAEELDHIRMSCEAGRLEAETYLAMGNAELKATLERNIRVFCAARMSVSCPVPALDHFRIDGPVRNTFSHATMRLVHSLPGSTWPMAARSGASRHWSTDTWSLRCKQLTVRLRCVVPLVTNGSWKPLQR